MDSQTGAQARIAGSVKDRLAGKVVIVTGAGQGIGRAAASRMAEEGAHLAIADLNDEGLRRTLQDLKAFDVRSAGRLCDLTTWEAAKGLIDWTIAEFGHVDVLVNNVGGASRLQPFQDWDPEAMVAEVHRSLLPTLFACRAVLPHMLERGSGRIVNVGAESVRNGLWDRAPYSTGKGGVHALTTSIAREVADKGITCNCVAPSHTLSVKDRLVDRHGSRVVSDAEKAHRKQLAERTLGTLPIGRYAESIEQAAAIAFLASDDASYITGQILSVNGGSSMM